LIFGGANGSTGFLGRPGFRFSTSGANGSTGFFGRPGLRFSSPNAGAAVSFFDDAFGFWTFVVEPFGRPGFLDSFIGVLITSMMFLCSAESIIEIAGAVRFRRQ
jgi:hypothetical protein